MQKLDGYSVAINPSLAKLDYPDVLDDQRWVCSGSSDLTVSLITQRNGLADREV